MRMIWLWSLNHVHFELIWYVRFFANDIKYTWYPIHHAWFLALKSPEMADLMHDIVWKHITCQNHDYIWRLQRAIQRIPGKWPQEWNENRVRIHLSLFVTSRLKKKISQRKSIATQSESIKLAPRVHGSKSGQNKVFSSSPPSRLELKKLLFRFNRSTQLSQSVLTTWKYVLWIGLYRLEVSSLSKIYCRPDSSSGFDLWT
jgi:hypothetical protein